MLVLGIDTATQVCCVGLVRGTCLPNGSYEEELIGEYLLNVKKTHSQRLLPLIDALLSDVGIDKKELTGIAVASGPGSFTGIRIGMATAKGLAQALDISLTGISTLDIIAARFAHTDYLICPILNARRNQVYTAIYQNTSCELKRLSEYMALSLHNLVAKLQDFPAAGYLFPGDAPDVYQSFLQDNLEDKYRPLPPVYRLNQGSIVAWLGQKKLQSNSKNELYSLSPLYVRKPEAEVNWEARSGK